MDPYGDSRSKWSRWSNRRDRRAANRRKSARVYTYRWPRKVERRAARLALKRWLRDPLEVTLP